MQRGRDYVDGGGGGGGEVHHGRREYGSAGSPGQLQPPRHPAAVRREAPQRPHNVEGAAVPEGWRGSGQGRGGGATEQRQARGSTELRYQVGGGAGRARPTALARRPPAQPPLEPEFEVSGGGGPSVCGSSGSGGSYAGGGGHFQGAGESSGGGSWIEEQIQPELMEPPPASADEFAAPTRAFYSEQAQPMQRLASPAGGLGG